MAQNFADQLSELSEQMNLAYGIISNVVWLGYLDEKPDDNDQVRDLKQTARDWLQAYNAGVRER